MAEGGGFRDNVHKQTSKITKEKTFTTNEDGKPKQEISITKYSDGSQLKVTTNYFYIDGKIRKEEYRSWSNGKLSDYPKRLLKKIAPNLKPNESTTLKSTVTHPTISTTSILDVEDSESETYYNLRRNDPGQNISCGNKTAVDVDVSESSDYAEIDFRNGSDRRKRLSQPINDNKLSISSDDICSKMGSSMSQSHDHHVVEIEKESQEIIEGIREPVKQTDSISKSSQITSDKPCKVPPRPHSAHLCPPPKPPRFISSRPPPRFISNRPISHPSYTGDNWDRNNKELQLTSISMISFADKHCSDNECVHDEPISDLDGTKSGEQFITKETTHAEEISTTPQVSSDSEDDYENIGENHETARASDSTVADDNDEDGYDFLAAVRNNLKEIRQQAAGKSGHHFYENELPSQEEQCPSGTRILKQDNGDTCEHTYDIPTQDENTEEVYV